MSLFLHSNHFRRQHLTHSISHSILKPFRESSETAIEIQSESRSFSGKRFVIIWRLIDSSLIDCSIAKAIKIWFLFLKVFVCGCALQHTHLIGRRYVKVTRGELLNRKWFGNDRWRWVRSCWRMPPQAYWALNVSIPANWKIAQSFSFRWFAFADKRSKILPSQLKTVILWNAYYVCRTSFTSWNLPDKKI